MTTKNMYKFGNGQAEGGANMKNLLGGKGANLAEMNRVGVPVPAGFTLTTEVCNFYVKEGRDKALSAIEKDVAEGIRHIEGIMGNKFGDKDDPLLVSVRSGARKSMPGMMDTVLNLGLNDTSVSGIAKKTNNERFAWDSYRRFIQMYGDVVLGIEAETSDSEEPFEEIIQEVKKEKGVENDVDLETEDLKKLVEKFKQLVKKSTGKDFPQDPWDQLWGAIIAVFDSWMNDRAVYYRKMNKIPVEWGTAVNVQAMVFGNMGNASATGVGFTRDAATGENRFNGEYLKNAQGEDVVAGIRTPQEITLEGSKRWADLQGISEEERKTKYPSLEEEMPDVYKELYEVQQNLENHYKDMQDLEFTIQEGKLWLLQTRNGKRTGAAMVKMAVDMLEEGLIDEKTAIQRVEPQRLDELLHPVFQQDSLKQATVVGKGLPASPGAAAGHIAFFADDAEKMADNGKDVILVRTETSPDDLKGMDKAKGILTKRGGMTSHAAVVARGMGKCCVAGAGNLEINYKEKTLKAEGKSYKEGDYISLNGTTGEIYDGGLTTKDPEMSGEFAKLMELSDKYSRMYVRTNADTPKDAKKAKEFGAKGIGLCRTEHMFFEGERITAMREMILADTEDGRRKALEKLLPMQREDFEGIFEAMEDMNVTVRLLDPPLHEFVPHEEKHQKTVAKNTGISLEKVQERISELEEANPMLGHRGCRLGITYPEITEMQTRAIIEAAINLKKKGVKARPEIMVPLAGRVEEYEAQDKVIRETANQVFEETGEKVDYKVGTMIEVPRAALTADEIAEKAEFFSFGTNDLTQMAMGFSRDDAGKFIEVYQNQQILKFDPFQTLDQAGVGQLVEMGTKKGRQTNEKLSVGICGEHGGDPDSIEFCNKANMDYVSCSPFRVPIARLAAAISSVED